VRVIQCPYCRTPLTETTPACPKCSLDLDRASAVMGPVPRLSALGITDFTETLKPRDEKRLHRTIREFHLRFPQSRVAVVFSRFDSKFPLAAHLFWLFNTAPVSGESCKRGDNRDLLIGIDPDRRLAGLTVGYGLEPFLDQDALDRALELARPHLEKDDFPAAVLTILNALSRLMEEVCRELGDLLGLEQNFVLVQQPGEF